MQEGLLYGKLDSVNTRFPIVKKVTGVDILADIRKVGKSLDTVTCDAGFQDCLYRAILLCKDMHISPSRNYPHQDYDSSFVRQAEESTRFLGRSAIFWRYNPRVDPFSVYYVDGAYFTPEIICKDDSATLIPFGFKLLKINELSMDEYMEKWVIPVYYGVRWHKGNKKFYATSLLSPERVGQSDQFIATYAYEGEMKEVDFKKA